MSPVAKQVCHVPVTCTVILVCFSKCRTTLCFPQQLCYLQQPDMLQDRFVACIVKGATLLFNLFCSNVAKQVAQFCYRFYCNFTLVSPCHVPLMPYHVNLWRSKLLKPSPFKNLPSNISLRTADVSPCSSPLRDVSRGGTSVTQRQKFHTEDAKSVRNPVRRANWSTE